jgi:hypothetical protein
MGDSMRRVDQGPRSRGFLAWLCGPRLPRGALLAPLNHRQACLSWHQTSVTDTPQPRLQSSMCIAERHRVVILTGLHHPSLFDWLGYADGLQLEAMGQC